MVILNHLLSFVIILAQLIFLLWVSTLLTTLVNKTIGKPDRLSLREKLTRKILTRGMTTSDYMAVFLFLSFIIIHIIEAGYVNFKGQQWLLVVILLLLLTIKVKLKTFIFLTTSCLLLAFVKHIELVKYYISSDTLNTVLNVVFIEFGILAKALSLLLALLTLKDAFKKMYVIPTISGLITCSVLTIYIIKVYFGAARFPYVLTNGLEFESFGRALGSYASVCMHYISIYLLMNLYVFTRKRPRLFLNQL